MTEQDGTKFHLSLTDGVLPYRLYHDGLFVAELWPEAGEDMQSLLGVCIVPDSFTYQTPPPCHT